MVINRSHGRRREEEEEEEEKKENKGCISRSFYFLSRTGVGGSGLRKRKKIPPILPFFRTHGTPPKKDRWGHVESRIFLRCCVMLKKRNSCGFAGNSRDCRFFLLTWRISRLRLDCPPPLSFCLQRGFLEAGAE